MSFGDRLRKLRLESNMTQESLSKKLNVSRATVGRYETDERFPDKNLLKKIADTFEVSIDYLLGRTDNRNGNIYCKEPHNTEYSKSSSYKMFENEILKRLLEEKIIVEGESISPIIFERILKYGLEATIEILKLEKKLEK